MRVSFLAFSLILLFSKNALSEEAKQSGSADVSKIDFKQEIQFNVEKYKLDNGLTVLLQEDHSSPIVSFHQWFRVGSKDEKPGRTGLAHFFEHLMFKGTDKYPGSKLDYIIQANGGDNNAFTSNDYTGYYENMPSGKLELVLDIESDRMRNLLFKQEEINSEREVVKEERRMRTENSVYGELREVLFSTLFKVHPYKWPVVGYMKDLNAASMDDIKDFYRVHYAPNNAVIVIAGDFDPSKAKSWIQKYYGNIKPQPLPERKYSSEPEQKGQRNVTIHRNVQSTTLAVAFKASQAGDSDTYAFDLLSNILGEGTSSRLYKRLVYRDQLATSVSAYAYTPQNPGFFSVTVTSKPGASDGNITQAVFAELYKIRAYKVSEEELQKAKNQIMKSYVDGLKTISGKAYALASNEVLFGDYRNLFKDLDEYAQVTPERIQQVAKKYLTPEKRSVVRVIPKG
ncbi:MAG: insulinase family protein [Bdellovibrionales bacterium]|nr:insulinase family protein [Bdellovibrionales bacterium]